MRLIDADTLIAEYDRVHVGEPGGARKLMENAPTVDAVPVIRCRDCFFHGEFDENGYCVCECTGAGMPMDGFCSDGERKGNGFRENNIRRHKETAKD